ncbi:Hypothetical protein EHI5A_144970 [Entamoeba histolytica KU27]|uniref:PX domain-containing protein n=1 Tax=Entamoeba histolytica KU27 TaxID=885311 RepID=M2SBU2_ENTHI|nr:Hypothetical protein EHI5A_144970 [Entamoeba histolytica KU27]
MLRSININMDINLIPIANTYEVDLKWCGYVHWNAGKRRYSDFLKLFELLCERYDEDDFPEFPGKLLVHSEEMLAERRYDLTLYCHSLLTSTMTFLDPIVVTFFKIPTSLLYLYLPKPINYYQQYKTILSQNSLRDIQTSALQTEIIEDEIGKRWLQNVRIISTSLLQAPSDFQITVEEYINPMNGIIKIPDPFIITNDNIYEFNSKIRKVMGKAMELVEKVQQLLFNVPPQILNEIFELKVETQNCIDSVMYNKITLDRDSIDIRMLCYRTITDVDIILSDKLMPLLGKSAVVSSLGRIKQMFWMPYNDNGNFMRMEEVFN